MKKNSVIIVNLGDIKTKVFSDSFKECSVGTESLIHTHVRFEFHLILNGEVILDVDGNKSTLSKNDSVLIFPDTFHKFGGTNNSKILSFNFAIEKNNKVPDMDYYSNFFNRTNEGNGFEIIKQNTIIAEYIRKIVANINLQEPFSREITEALLTLLLSEIMSPLCSTEISLNDTKFEMSEFDSRVQIIESYYNEHYMEDISLKKLSVLLHLSEKQINRMIKKNFGTEFREHLSKIRLKNAQKLLRESNDSVKDIAEEVGYKSYNGFYLAFKNKYGITPLEYRNRSK